MNRKPPPTIVRTVSQRRHLPEAAVHSLDLIFHSEDVDGLSALCEAPGGCTSPGLHTSPHGLSGPADGPLNGQLFLRPCPI